MKILVIGGAGFLGNNLVRKCLQYPKNKVTVVDSLDPRLQSDKKNLHDVLSKITFMKGDMRNAQLMERVVKNQDVIYNCAGQTSHPLSLQDPFYDIDINCVGNLTVLEAVRKYNPQAKVIYTSSSTVTGRARHIHIDEEHAERPLDIYSANKSAAEKYYFIYSQIYGLKTLSLRFANLFGAYGKGSPQFGFINYFIDLAYRNKEITLYGNGKQKRNVMYVEDAVDLLYRSIRYPRLFGDIYFAAHRNHHSVMNIAKKIVSVFGSGTIKRVPWPKIRKKMEIDDIIITGERLFYHTKWEPKYTLVQGLRRTKEILDTINK